MSDSAADELMNIMNDMNADKPGNYTLTDDEKDALGEIANICMGTSATTLSALLGKQVSITTPRVSIANSALELGSYEKPYVSVEVSYTEGIAGYNILLLKEEDVMIITDILMGGTGVYDPNTVLDELHYSAISEVMNQMVGSASTSLADIIKVTVNISPPNVKQIKIDEEDLMQLACHNDTIIKISFSMTIEGVLDSEIMQIMPFDFGKQLAYSLLNDVMSAPEPQPAPPPPPPPPKAAAPQPAPQSAPPPPRPAPQEPQPEKSRVGVKSVQYQSFDSPAVYGDVDGRDNMNLILDVPLQVTVELGKCRKSIKEILSFNVGSVIVLDRLAGEMVDILVNGKLFAKGEVVVIDDSYGVRVTDIIASIGN
jgi:flagellar motor switch protein FliN/FliY